MMQRGGSGINIYNAQRIVAENKTSARQLQASGVSQDQQPGKRSLLELLAAAREVQDWALYASILKNIRRRLNVSYGLNCALKESAKVFSDHIRPTAFDIRQIPNATAVWNTLFTALEYDLRLLSLQFS